MKLNTENINYIQAEFAAICTKQDLLSLLNYAKKLIYGEKAHPITLKQLTFYVNPDFPYNKGKKEGNIIARTSAVNLEVPSKKEKKAEDMIVKQSDLNLDLLRKYILKTYQSNHRYTQFQVPKKNGTVRNIHAPKPGLKVIQRCLALILQTVYTPFQHKAAMGFVPDRSIVDNAKLHVGQTYVYNIDLKDFFPSIDQARVWKLLQLKPFNLNEKADADLSDERRSWSVVKAFTTDHQETIFYRVREGKLFLIDDKKGNLKRYRQRIIAPITEIPVPKNTGTGVREYFNRLRQRDGIFNQDVARYIHLQQELEIAIASRQQLANMIASLCSTNIEVERKNDKGEWIKVSKNVLPQGAPTSPLFTNIVCQRLDFLLTGVAKRFGLKYSRYADDITFSSMHNVYKPGSAFIAELQRIIIEQGFHIKESKTRLQKDGYRKEVTGLLVNENVNVQQRYIKQLRMWLYYWERYGYERASGFFLHQYVADKGHVKNGKPDMANVISGKLDYLKMVKGADNELYIKLRNRFEVLKGSSIINVDRNQHLDKVIKKLFTNGLDDAMDIYKPIK